MNKLYIIGSGGFGREVAWLVERINQKKPTWDLVGFIDDNESKKGSFEGKYEVLGSCEYLQSINEPFWVVCAIGTAKIREQVVKKLYNYSNLKFATLIDPSVILSEKSNIDEGTIICASSILTVDYKIGKHVIINLDCTIGHDAIIKDFVTCYPSANISGNVNIGKCTEIGTGTNIIQGITIASDAIIGAGSVVNKNIDEKGTYVGVPARRIK